VSDFFINAVIGVEALALSMARQQRYRPVQWRWLRGLCKYTKDPGG